MAKFTFHNSGQFSYFTLRAIPRETDGFYPTSSNQITFISGAGFSDVTSSIKNETFGSPFVEGDFQWSVALPLGTSSFIWPSGSTETATTVPASESQMAATGEGTLTIGETTFNLQDLTSFTFAPELTPGDGGGSTLATMSNAFSMTFNDADNTRISSNIASGLGLGIYNTVPVLGWQTPLTITSWVKNTNAGSWASTGFSHIEGIGMGTSTFGEAYFQSSNLKIRFGDVYSDIILNLNEFYHIAQVYTPNLSVPSASIFETYINGVKTTWKTYTNVTKEPTFATWWGTGPYQFGGTLFIGGDDSTLGWDGIIDEVAVFTSSLDASTIESIYSASLPLGSGVTADLSTLSTPPLAWYRMGD